MKADPGFLQKLGLPVPVRCDLAGDFVGAERTCQLTGGITISAQLTEFERGKSLKMTVFDWLANMTLPSGQEKFDIFEVRFKNGRKAFFKNWFKHCSCHIRSPFKVYIYFTIKALIINILFDFFFII